MLRRGSMIFTGTEKELAEFDENVRRMTQESLGFNDAEMAWYESLPEDQSGAFSRRRALERVNSPRWTAPRFLAAPERFERKTNAEKEKFIQWRDEHLDHSGDISDLYHRAGYSSWRAQEAESFEGLADEWRVELADFERYRAFILGIRGFVERNPEYYQTVFLDVMRSQTGFVDAESAVRPNLIDVLADHLAVEQKKGELDPSLDPGQLSEMLNGIYNYTILNCGMRNFSYSLVDRITKAAEIFVEGCAPGKRKK